MASDFESQRFSRIGCTRQKLKSLDRIFFEGIGATHSQGQATAPAGSLAAAPRNVDQRERETRTRMAADNAIYDKEIRAMRSKGLGLLNATKASLKSERQIVARYKNLALDADAYREEDD